MKKLQIIDGDDGTFFFDGNKIITYIHANDGNWRGEYMNGILEYFGIEIEYLDEPTKEQEKQIRDSGLDGNDEDDNDEDDNDDDGND